MNKKRVLYFIDSKYRDTYPAISVKQEIAGFVDYFACSFDLWEQAIKLISPHVVVLNHILGKRNKLISSYVKAYGGMIVVVPTEGRPNNDSIRDWYCNSSDPYFYDLFLCWNKDMADHLSKAKVVGGPRFDAYRTDRQSRKSRAVIADRLGLDPNKKTIVVASSFPQAKFSYRNSEFNDADWHDLKVTTIPGRENPKEFADNELASMDHFVDYINRLAAQHKDYQFVIKPHPMEDHGWWKNKHGRIIHTIEMHNLLAVADLLIAKAGCLTHQDAWLSGVPSLCIEETGLHDASVSGASKESLELMGVITKDLKLHSKKISTKHVEFLNKWGFTSDAISSSWKIGKEIMALIESNETSAPDPDLVGFFNVASQHADARNLIDYAGHIDKTVDINYLALYEQWVF